MYGLEGAQVWRQEPAGDVQQSFDHSCEVNAGKNFSPRWTASAPRGKSAHLGSRECSNEEPASG